MKLYSDAALAKILDQEIFHQISHVADTMGVECYVVGGYVRDIFLERPSNDIDVVVVGSGIAVAEQLKRQLGKRAHLSVFRNFGTAQVKYTRKEEGRGRKENCSVIQHYYFVLITHPTMLSAYGGGSRRYHQGAL